MDALQQSMMVYLETPLAAMRALDAERMHAEQFCEDRQVWANLARRYLAQGRPAQAASCERRAAHYAQVEQIFQMAEVVYESV